MEDFAVQQEGLMYSAGIKDTHGLLGSKSAIRCNWRCTYAGGHDLCCVFRELQKYKWYQTAFPSICHHIGIKQCTQVSLNP